MTLLLNKYVETWLLSITPELKAKKMAQSITFSVTDALFHKKNSKYSKTWLFDFSDHYISE